MSNTTRIIEDQTGDIVVMRDGDVSRIYRRGNKNLSAGHQTDTAEWLVIRKDELPCDNGIRLLVAAYERGHRDGWTGGEWWVRKEFWRVIGHPN